MINILGYQGNMEQKQDFDASGFFSTDIYM